MAKIYFDADIQGISGRLSKKDNVMYVRNKKTGKCHRVEYNTEYKSKNTSLQQEVKTIFTSKSKVAADWWAANKPANEEATPTAEWTAMMKKYNAQSKYGNPYHLVRAKVKDDLTVTFITSTASSDSGSSSSGGSQQSGGTQGGGTEGGNDNPPVIEP